MAKKKGFIITSFILVMLIVDQVVKFIIKTNMTLGESIDLFSWFKIVFVENPGMAFGMTIGSKWILTTFRIVVSALVLYYLYKMIKIDYKMSYISVIAMVFAGAVGNIIDCLFYGVCFSESTYYSVATFLPSGGGYAPLMMGKVVDMLYFPLFTFPDWIPLLGGQIFFSPVFNVADSFITVSIFLIILFFRQEFNETMEICFSSKKKDSSKAS